MKRRAVRAARVQLDRLELCALCLLVMGGSAKQLHANTRAELERALPKLLEALERACVPAATPRDSAWLIKFRRRVLRQQRSRMPRLKKGTPDEKTTRSVRTLAAAGHSRR